MPYLNDVFFSQAIHERKRQLLRLSQTRMKVADIVSTSVKTDPVGGHNGVTLLDINGAIKITDFGLYTMGRVCTTLQTLNLGGCVRVTDAGVRAAVKDCSNLISLSLSSIPGLKGHALEAVGACCPRLKALYLANATWLKCVAGCVGCWHHRALIVVS